MKTLYLDVFSGISGDMFVGALLDLGVTLEQLQEGLRRLEVGGYHLHVERQVRSGIAGFKFDVHLEHGHGDPHGHDQDREHMQGEASHHQAGHGQDAGEKHHHGHRHGHHHGMGEEVSRSAAAHGPLDEFGEHRTFSDIQRMLEGSGLSDWVRQRSQSVFLRIAEAEAKVHDMAVGQVHFHEVGAIDSIVDIVSACIGLEVLGRPRVVSGPVVEGTGFVRCAHGRFPIPAPATLAILGARGIPIDQCEEPGELVTPTGAALLAEFAEAFGPMRGLVAQRIGYGVGTRQNRTRPNVLRAILGELEGGDKAEDGRWERDEVMLLETNVDDANPEWLGHVVDLALEAGALDVFHTPVLMKKNRPGTQLSILCEPGDRDRFALMMLEHTTAFGVRFQPMERRKLRREFRDVVTRYGPVTVKCGWLGQRLIHVTPEFESCRRIAMAAGQPVREVYGEVMAIANAWKV